MGSITARISAVTYNGNKNGANPYLYNVNGRALTAEEANRNMSMHTGASMPFLAALCTGGDFASLNAWFSEKSIRRNKPEEQTPEDSVRDGFSGEAAAMALLYAQQTYAQGSRLIVAKTGNLCIFHAQESGLQELLSGTPQAGKPELFTLNSVADGDMLLLCSRSLTAVLSETQILAALSSSPKTEVVSSALLREAAQEKPEEAFAVVVIRLAKRELKAPTLTPQPVVRPKINYKKLSMALALAAIIIAGIAVLVVTLVNRGNKEEPETSSSSPSLNEYTTDPNFVTARPRGSTGFTTAPFEEQDYTTTRGNNETGGRNEYTTTRRTQENTQRPTEKPTEKPTDKPSSERPTQKPTTDRPTTPAPTTKQPTTTAEPTEKPTTTEKPTKPAPTTKASATDVDSDE